MLSPEELEEIQKRVENTTEGPWFYDSYSGIYSEPLVKKFPDGPKYPKGPRPGPPYLEGEDLKWYRKKEKAYFNEPAVASVPPICGDTATGRRAADAYFIAEARQDVPKLLEMIQELQDQLMIAKGYIPDVE